MSLLAIIALTAAPTPGAAEDALPRTIELHQTACQFIKAEGGDRHYSATTYDACEALNARTGEARLAKSAAIRLSPGSYVFRVYNDDVPYTLGFWLRGSGLGRVTLPSVSGGGIEPSDFREYAIDLRAGEYRYSCPLNPTPDYVLLVE